MSKGPLTATKLRALALGLAARPHLWQRHVRHDAAERTYTRLLLAEHVEIWLVCWMPGHDTGFHDHDDSAAGVAVAEGAVVDERLALGGDPRVAHHGPGEAFDVAPSAIHRVRHAGDEPTVTIHAYSPPLRRVGTYEVDPDGTLLRHSQDAEEELRATATAGR
jgi:predicted metal-dependent enzyme (double-stranded beta helix superfamily)